MGDIEETSVEETTIATTEQPTDYDLLLEKMDGLQNTGVMIFWAVVVAAAIRVIHNTFNRFRGIE